MAMIEHAHSKVSNSRSVFPSVQQIRLLFSWVIGFAVQCSGINAADSALDLEGRAVEYLIDVSELVDTIDSVPHAFLMNGSRTALIHGIVDVPMIFVAAQTKPGIRLDCWSYSTRRRFSVESWQQRLSDGGGVKIRVDSPANAVMRTLGEDDADQLEGELVRPFYPVQQSLSMPTNLAGGGTLQKIVERILTGKIVESSVDENGDLTAVWELTGPSTFLVEVTFSQEIGFLPVDAKWSIAHDGTSRLLCRQKTTWKRFGKKYLPIAYEGVYISNVESHFAFQIDWKLGDQLKEKKLVDSSLDDWREPLRILFETDWQRRGDKPIVLPSQIGTQD